MLKRCLYEDNLTGSGVAVVDAASRRVVRCLNTGVQPYGLAVAPDGRLWVPIHGGRGRPAPQVRRSAPGAVGGTAGWCGGTAGTGR